MGKHKDSEAMDTSINGNHTEEESYEEKLKGVNKIAQPIASRKTCGRIYKLIKKGKLLRLISNGLVPCMI